MQKIRSIPENFIYTNISVDSHIHVLGYDLDTGSKVYYQSNTIPDLSYFVEGDKTCKYRSFITGRYLRQIKCKTISDYKKDTNQDIEGLKIYGDYNLPGRWINTTCGPKIKKNIENYLPKAIELINIGYIDIETDIGPTFPHPETAEYAITAITLYASRSKIFYIFSCKDVTTNGLKKLKKLIEEEKKSKYPLHGEAQIEFRSYNHNEEQMLMDFCKIMNEQEEIDILTGWNSSNFDIPYLYFRMKRLFGENGADALSPLGSSYDYFSKRKNKHIIDIKGITLIDSLNTYQDFTRNIKILPSYSLDYVSTYELGVGKAKLPGTLKETYEQHYDDYIFYNLTDTIRLVQVMEAKKFFYTMMIIAYKYYSVQLKDVLSPVIGWESIVFQNTYHKNLVFERKAEKQAVAYPGAYIHNVVPGFYKHIVSMDVNSMYPHIQMGWYISPETHISRDEDLLAIFGDVPALKDILELRNNAPDLADTNYQAEWWDENVLIPLMEGRFDLSFLNGTDICMTPSLEFFRKDENALMPTQLSRIYNDRKKLRAEENNLKAEAEKKKNNKEEHEKLLYLANLKKIEQIALKIVINAEYGAFASAMFMFFEPRIARSITITGRYIIQCASRFVEREFNELIRRKFNCNRDYIHSWIYSDTDSSYFQLTALIEEVNKVRASKNMPPLTWQQEVELLDSFASDEIQGMLERCFSELAQQFHAKKTIVMKRENIALTGIWRNLKKHYALLVADEEGTRFTEPEVHKKGTQFVSTSIPEKCKEKYDAIIETLLKASDPKSNETKIKVMKIIDDFRDTFTTVSLHEICEPVGTNNIERYIDSEGKPLKGAPFNVKAANCYNNFLKKNHLIEQGYQPIQSGTKVRILPLKKGNPYDGTAFGFVSELPPGFDKRYIDYSEMFYKNFLKYVEEFFKEIGITWALKETECEAVDDIF